MLIAFKCSLGLILKSDLNGFKLNINDPFSFHFFKARETELTCEDKTMMITCPTGILFIEKAIYGRTKDRSVCPHNSIRDTNCISTESEAITKRICDGESECSIDVKNDVLGRDPCPGTYKYLEVHYICH